MEERVNWPALYLIVGLIVGLFFGAHFLPWSSRLIRIAQVGLVFLAGGLLARWLQRNEVAMAEEQGSRGPLYTLWAEEPIVVELPRRRIPAGEPEEVAEAGLEMADQRAGFLVTSSGLAGDDHVL